MGESNFDLLNEDDLIPEDKTKKEHLVYDKAIKEGKKGVFEMEKGKLFMLASQTGVAKTWISIHMSERVASGSLVFGKFITAQTNVLYIDLENGRDEIARRYWRLTDKKSGHFYHITNNEYRKDGKTEPIDLTIDPVNAKGKVLGSIPLVNVLEMLIREKNIGLVIIDPLIFISQGNENDTGAMRDLFKILKKIIFETGTTILVNHHINKGGYDTDEIKMIRGNSAITGMCDYVYLLTKQNESDEDREGIVVKNLKNRGAPRKPDFVIGMYDSYDNKQTYLVYEGLLKVYKAQKIGRCRADVLRMIREATQIRKEPFLTSALAIDTLKGKYSDAVVEQAIRELKEEGEIKLYNDEKGKLIFS